MLDLMAGEWVWFDWVLSILLGFPGESIRPPLRMVSSSSGVGGRGRDGPFAGTAVTDLAGSSGPEELRWGSSSRRGLGFLTLASIVPSRNTGPSSSEESSSTRSLSSGGGLGLFELEGTLCLSLCLGGPGEGTRSCNCLASSSS